MENIKEFRNILLGHEIELFTDHKNITCETIESASQRVQRWKTLKQEFGVTLLYIKVYANIVSGAFSRITMVHHVHKLADTTLE